MFKTHIPSASRSQLSDFPIWLSWTVDTVHITVFFWLKLMLWCVLVLACIRQHVSALLFFCICPSQLLAKSDRKIASTQGCICIWVAVTCATIWPMQQPARPLHPVCFRTEQLAICLFSVCNWRYRPGVHIAHTTLACHLFVKSKIMTTSQHHQLHVSFH